MPRQYTYTAEVNPTPAVTPLRFFESGQSQEAAIVDQVGREASQVAQLGFAVSRTQDELQFSSFKGQYEAGKDLIEQQLTLDPNMRTIDGAYEQEYQNQLAKLQQTLIDGTQRDRVKAALGNLFNRTQAQDLVKAQGHALKLRSASAIAELNDAEDRLSSLAVEGDPAKRNEYITEYRDLVQGFYNKGLIQEKEKQKRDTDFMLKFQGKAMAFQAGNDPTGLVADWNAGVYKDVPADIQQRWLRVANEHISAATVKTHQDMQAFRVSIHDDWASRAINGRLTDAELQDAKDGKNYWVRPEEALHFQSLRDNPQGGDKNVMSVMDELNSITRPTQADFDKTMARLNQIDTPSKALEAAKTKVQVEARTVQAQSNAEAGQARANRSAEQAAQNQRVTNMQREITAAHDYYDQFLKTVKLSGFGDNRRIIDKAIISDQIRQIWGSNQEMNYKMRELVDDIIGARKTAPKSDQQKDLDAVRGK